VISPIASATSIDQVAGLVEAVELELTPEEVRLLDGAVTV